MYSSTHGGITVSVFFDTRRAVEGDKYPVKIRVRYKRDRRDYITGKKMTVEEWDKISTTKSTKFIKLRDEIQASFKIIDVAVESLYREDRFSFDALNVRLGKCTTDTLNTAFVSKMDVLKNDGAIGNMLNYQTAIRSIESFAGNKIDFNNITTDWLKRYEKHLLSEGKSYVTVSIYKMYPRDNERCKKSRNNQRGAISFWKGQIRNSNGRRAKTCPDHSTNKIGSYLY